MVQRAEALVLEDNLRELEETSDLILGCGLVPFATVSPQRAINWLGAREAARSEQSSRPRSVASRHPPRPLLHSPALAVVDWNMELSGDEATTAEPVLRKLYSLHPDTLVIVYGAGVGTDLDLEERIAGAHPAAIRHDKQRGASSLLTHITTLLSVSWGDLCIDRGAVLHVPSGVRYRHGMALKLMLAYPRAIFLEPKSSAYRAAYRFGEWLKEIGSTVSLISPRFRTSFYQLEVVDNGETAPD